MSTRKRDAEAMRQRLTKATAAVRATREVWGLWADSVRQDAEARHGVAAGADLKDPEHWLALDCGAALDQARQALLDAEARFNQTEQAAAENTARSDR